MDASVRSSRRLPSTVPAGSDTQHQFPCRANLPRCGPPWPVLGCVAISVAVLVVLRETHLFTTPFQPLAVNPSWNSCVGLSCLHTGAFAAFVVQALVHLVTLSFSSQADKRRLLAIVTIWSAACACAIITDAMYSTSTVATFVMAGCTPGVSAHMTRLVISLRCGPDASGKFWASTRFWLLTWTGPLWSASRLLLLFWPSPSGTGWAIAAIVIFYAAALSMVPAVLNFSKFQPLFSNSVLLFGIAATMGSHVAADIIMLMHTSYQGVLGISLGYTEASYNCILLTYCLVWHTMTAYTTTTSDETALARAERDTVQAALKMQTAKLAAKDLADVARQRFMRYIFHEVRVPFNSVDIGLSLLQEEEQNNLSREGLVTVDMMIKAAGCMRTILNDSLDLSKLESGAFQVLQTPTRICDIVSGTIMSMTLAAADNDARVTLVAKLDPHFPGWLLADKVRIQQVIANLTSNAIKFAPHDGTGVVTVTLTVIPDEAMVPSCSGAGGTGTSGLQSWEHVDESLLVSGCGIDFHGVQWRDPGAGKGKSSSTEAMVKVTAAECGPASGAVEQMNNGALEGVGSAQGKAPQERTVSGVRSVAAFISTGMGSLSGAGWREYHPPRSSTASTQARNGVVRVGSGASSPHAISSTPTASTPNSGCRDTFGDRPGAVLLRNFPSVSLPASLAAQAMQNMRTLFFSARSRKSRVRPQLHDNDTAGVTRSLPSSSQSPSSGQNINIGKKVSGSSTFFYAASPNRSGSGIPEGEDCRCCGACPLSRGKGHGRCGGAIPALPDADVSPQLHTQLQKTGFPVEFMPQDSISRRSEGGTGLFSRRSKTDADKNDSLSVRHCTFVLTVKDNGAGLAPIEARELFTAFRQLDAGLQHKGKGTGLGLSICHEIISHHSGRVGVRSSLGEGAEFLVLLRLPVLSGPPLSSTNSDPLSTSFGRDSSAHSVAQSHSGSVNERETLSRVDVEGGMRMSQIEELVLGSQMLLGTSCRAGVSQTPTQDSVPRTSGWGRDAHGNGSAISRKGKFDDGASPEAAIVQRALAQRVAAMAAASRAAADPFSQVIPISHGLHGAFGSATTLSSVMARSNTSRSRRSTGFSDRPQQQPSPLYRGSAWAANACISQDGSMLGDKGSIPCYAEEQQIDTPLAAAIMGLSASSTVGARPMRLLVVDDVLGNRRLLARALKSKLQAAGKALAAAGQEVVCMRTGLVIEVMRVIVDECEDGRLAVMAVTGWDPCGTEPPPSLRDARMGTGGFSQDALPASTLPLPYDNVTMDAEMPVMSGFQATTIVRKMGFTGGIYGCTGNSLAEDQQLFLDAGADRVFIKPVHVAELTEVILSGLHVRTRTDSASPPVNTPVCEALPY